VGVVALGRLVLALGAAPFRRIGLVEAFSRWAQRQRDVSGCPALLFGVAGRRVMLVTGADLSRHILDAAPDERAYIESGLKRSSMAFLAPTALTISHGDAWARRRTFNERVLDLDAAPGDRAALLTAIRSAFGTPLDSEEDVRERMRVVMLNLVVGEHAPASLGADIDYLIRLVNNPMRRAILGRFAAGRRSRFYTALRRARDEADAHSLLARSRDAAIVRGAEFGDDEAIEQVPHWMFPFTGSASDLLIRTLTMIGSRPDAWRRIEDELAAGTPTLDPEGIDSLAFIEACIQETGRLFPPVTRTFHTAPLGDTVNGVAVPADIEVVHFFPLLQRDPASSSDAETFRPEQWLVGASEMRPTSNLFLSGAREYPGRELVLFILKAAIATHVARHQRHIAAPSLGSDPVPFSYPRHEVEFLAGRPAQPSSDQTPTVEAG